MIPENVAANLSYLSCTLFVVHFILHVNIIRFRHVFPNMWPWISLISAFNSWCSFQNVSVQCSERIWPICAEGCVMCLLLQYVPSNKSYLLLFCQNTDSVHMSSSWFTISVHNLQSSPPGLIWSRYSLVIIPKNWNLFCVNFFLGSAGASQLYRIWRFVVDLQYNGPLNYHVISIRSIFMINYNK